MKDLIKALEIFSKYTDAKWPTHCEHDILLITNKVKPDQVNDEDKTILEELGFFVTDEYGDEVFASFRFGSC